MRDAKANVTDPRISFLASKTEPSCDNKDYVAIERCPIPEDALAHLSPGKPSECSTSHQLSPRH